MNAPGSSWTEERVAELKRMAALGWSASKIGFALKVTALAVIGKCTREGIALGLEANGLVRIVTAKAALRAEQKRQTAEADPMFGVAPPARADAWRPLPGFEPQPLEALRINQCSWPIGDHDAPPWACCAAPKPDDMPYCREHTALAYQGGRYRRPPQQVAQLANLAGVFR